MYFYNYYIIFFNYLNMSDRVHNISKIDLSNNEYENLLKINEPLQSKQEQVMKIN